MWVFHVGVLLHTLELGQHRIQESMAFIRVVVDCAVVQCARNVGEIREYIFVQVVMLRGWGRLLLRDKRRRRMVVVFDDVWFWMVVAVLHGFTDCERVYNSTYTVFGGKLNTSFDQRVCKSQHTGAL